MCSLTSAEHGGGSRKSYPQDSASEPQWQESVSVDVAWRGLSLPVSTELHWTL